MNRIEIKYHLPFTVDIEIEHKDGGMFPRKKDRIWLMGNYDIIKDYVKKTFPMQFWRINDIKPVIDYEWAKDVKTFPYKPTMMVVKCDTVLVMGVSPEEHERLDEKKIENLEKLVGAPAATLQSPVGRIFGRGICPNCFRDCTDIIRKRDGKDHYYCPDCENMCGERHWSDRCTL